MLITAVPGPDPSSLLLRCGSSPHGPSSQLAEQPSHEPLLSRQCGLFPLPFREGPSLVLC